MDGAAFRDPRRIASPAGFAPLQPYDVQDLWYRLLSRNWSRLAVVSPDLSPNTWRLVCSLAALGSRVSGRAVEPIDALGLDLGRAAAIAHMLAPGAGSADALKYVIAVDPPVYNPIAIGVIAACDAALLLLQKGKTNLPNARHTIDFVGREMLVGAFVVSD